MTTDEKIKWLAKLEIAIFEIFYEMSVQDKALYFDETTLNRVKKLLNEIIEGESDG